MGCLNSKGQFKHWFSNIHLSGPCNRKCYFCIGQHMMALDDINILDTWPLPNIDKFVDKLLEKEISEVNITGSNTDPLLYNHLPSLKEYLLDRIPNLKLGIRTNGVSILTRPDRWRLFDKGSISITSLNSNIYKVTMGIGYPPKLSSIKSICDSGGPIWDDIKINIVLCPEILENDDIWNTIYNLAYLDINTINIREPYGQPHIGNPFNKYVPRYIRKYLDTMHDTLGNKTYRYKRCNITYWDVHYTEVESVNLYANGIISETYPVTLGHDPVTGNVMGQEHFKTSGRIREQWVNLKVNK